MDEEEMVLLSLALSEFTDWATGADWDTSGTSGSSGISKDTAEENKTKSNI